jgi:predicted small lipoprotein YifL
MQYHAGPPRRPTFMMRSRLYRLLGLLLLLGPLLAGCGQRGELYLPAPAPADGAQNQPPPDEA